jgi:hypothetical protein
MHSGFYIWTNNEEKLVAVTLEHVPKLTYLRFCNTKEENHMVSINLVNLVLRFICYKIWIQEEEPLYLQSKHHTRWCGKLSQHQFQLFYYVN